jgi:hypothetical protein
MRRRSAAREQHRGKHHGCHVQVALDRPVSHHFSVRAEPFDKLGTGYTSAASEVEASAGNGENMPFELGASRPRSGRTVPGCGNQLAQ